MRIGWFSWCCSCCLVQRNYNRYKYIRDHDKGKKTDEGDINSKCGLMCCVQTFTTGWAHMILPVRFSPFPVILFKQYLITTSFLLLLPSSILSLP